jgi:hypothetical protein
VRHHPPSVAPNRHSQPPVVRVKLPVTARRNGVPELLVSGRPCSLQEFGGQRRIVVTEGTIAAHEGTYAPAG